VRTGEGVWIELDASSIQSYCHDQSGSAWCLVSSSTGEVFLRAECEISDALPDSQRSPFNTYTSSTIVKGFDFTKAAKTPTFSPFTSNTLPGIHLSLLCICVSMSTHCLVFICPYCVSVRLCLHFDTNVFRDT